MSKFVSELRERARNALEEGTATAQADARYFNAAADKIIELKAALKPFSVAADDYFDDDDNEPAHLKHFLVGDLRAAHAALGEKKAVQTLPITDRELLVEKLVNDGKTRKQVAEAVGVEPGSVANILNRVRVKRAYQALSHDASLEPDGDE
jgi:DNA-binding NarL/FixJ family response regulator